MATRQIHRRKFRCKNILIALNESVSYTGIGPQSVSFLPETVSGEFVDSATAALIPVFRRLEIQVGGNGGEKAVSGLRLLMEHLALPVSAAPPPIHMNNEDENGGGGGAASSSSAAAAAAAAAANPVQLDLVHVISASAAVSSSSSEAQTSFPEMIASRFVNLGGIQLILTLMLSPGKDDRSLQLQKRCLEVLARLCCLEKEAATLLRDSEEVIIFCFHSLPNDVLYDKATRLIELILMGRTQTLNLCSIPNLQKMLITLEGSKLASFCKILAVTVSDLDIFENKSSLFAQNQQKRSNIFIPVRDINQELMLSIPGFLKKLIAHACRLPYNPRFASTSSEIDHWIRLIDDKISDELGRASQFGDSSSEPASAIIGNDLMDRVEALYVLSLLLVGKHRKQVQKELSELEIMPKLSELFDNFIWRYNGGRQRTRLPGHNQGCECSPEVAVKIQFLRLVHSFCDHNDYKHLLLSPCEWDELRRISQRNSYAVQDLDLDTTPVMTAGSNLMCRGTSGLLSKIVEVLKKEQTNSTFRFWLCRAVESYLRGRISYADQVFLLRRGLLQHVTASLINTDLRQKEIIQSSFDLLGELVKFNIDACKQMDSILNTEAKLKKAMVLINEKLVDSNMFIRAMVLATDHFINSSGPEDALFAYNSRLLAFFRDFDKHVSYVIKLIRIINVSNLTQENVSCLNTSLVIMMLCHRQHKMAAFLNELSNRGPDEGSGSGGRTSFMLNLRNLLQFWQEHYLHKDKDCTQLEKSSRIPFEFWKTTVDCLVSNDETSKLSLIYYHNHHYLQNKNQRDEDKERTTCPPPDMSPPAMTTL